MDEVFYSKSEAKKILREILIQMRVKGPYVVELLDVIMPRDLKNFDEIYVVMEVVEADLRKLARSPQYLGDK